MVNKKVDSTKIVLADIVLADGDMFTLDFERVLELTPPKEITYKVIPTKIKLDTKIGSLTLMATEKYQRETAEYQKFLDMKFWSRLKWAFKGGRCIT